MSRPPSFQFYPKDYLADEAVSRMTLEQQGAYMRLLCYAWSMDKPGVLPNDDAVLAQLSTLGPRWPECRDAIARAFKISDTEWIQERMRRERRAQIKRKSHRSEAGKRGANARWHAEVNGQAIDLPLAKNSSSSSTAFASASAIATAKKEKRKKKPAASSQNSATPQEIDEALLARCAERFPDVDVQLVAEKVRAQYSGPESRRKLVGWCSAAKARGMDLKPQQSYYEKVMLEGGFKP